MADKSRVAEAYAEVRADLTKLPADLQQVPTLMRRMISTEGLKAVRDLVTGNVSGGLASIVTRTYTLQAERLQALSDAASEAAEEAAKEAKAREETARALEKEAEAASNVAKEKQKAAREAAEAEKEGKAAMARASDAAGKGGAGRASMEELQAEAKGHDQLAAALNREAAEWEKVAEDTKKSSLARTIARDKANRLREESAALVNKSGGLRAQAEALRAEVVAHENLASKLFKEADAYEKLAKAKAKAGAGSAGATAEANRLQALANAARTRAGSAAESADAKKLQAKQLAEQAGAMSKMGASVGGKVAIVAQVAMLALKAVAAVAAAYLAATVIAAQKASETLKTAQMVRATGEAAGWTAKQLEHMGENLRKNTKFGAGDIANAQSELLKRPNIKGDEFKKALDLAADLASVMGTDLPQAASELGDLLADPIKAAEGGLEKFGVLLNGVEQGQIRNAMAARDWQKAQGLVLGHLQKFSGAAKEAGETGAGGFEKLKNSILEAAAKIGGANGDIGALAAKVATAIDKFMELQIVKDVIDLVTFQWLDLSGAVNSFLEENGADFQTWSDQISEIYHNVRDGIIQAWEFVKAASKAVLDFIMEAFGTSWGEIKATVTAVLDEISLLTTDFGLTAKYVWVGIQLGAQELWDALRDGLSVMVIAFEAAWKSVTKGAEAAWDQIEKAFTGEGGGKSIGQAMAEGFEEGLREGTKKANLGESEAAKKLKKELADIRGDMQAARDKVRDRREAEAKRKADEKDKLEKKGKGSDYVNTKPFKFEFVGFEEMSKRIQTSLYPTEAIQLQKAGVEAAQQAVNNGKDANKKLDAINDNLGKGLGFKP